MRIITFVRLLGPIDSSTSGWMDYGVKLLSVGGSLLFPLLKLFKNYPNDS